MSLARPSSLALLLLCAVVAGIAPALAEDDAERVGEIGRADRLVIRGLDAIDPERLRRPLANDFEVHWLARPGAQRAPFVDALARKAQRALAAAGFATAKVVPSVETIDGTEKVVLDVSAGPRFEAGEIVVNGLDDDLAARLVTFLTSPLHPTSAIPELMDRPDGGTEVVCRGSDGRPVGPSPAAWVAGSPVIHADELLDVVRVRVTRFLGEEGYLTIAPPAQRSARGPVASSWNLTDAGIETAFDIADGRTAKLVVSVARLPPRSRLTRIDLPRGATTTAEEMAAFLGIELGQTVSQRDRIAWIGTLRDSGRFIRHGVELAPDLLDQEGVVATFDIDEYAPMMPLSRPLSREEETMLRGRRWLLGALEGERDLVIDCGASDPEEGSSGAFPFRATLSASDGTAIIQRLPTGDMQGCVMTPEIVRLIAPGGVGWFDLPAPRGQRFRFRLEASVRRRPAEQVTADDPRPFEYRMDFGYDSQDRRPGEAGADVAIKVDPIVAMLKLHHDDPDVRWEGDVLVVDQGAANPIRVDGRTGRVLSLDYGGGMTIEQREGGLDEAERLSVSVGEAKGIPNRPFTSLLRFLFVDGGSAFVTSLIPGYASTEALRAVCADTTAIIGRVVRRCDEDDSLAALDRIVLERFTAGDDETDTAPLWLPQLGIVGDSTVGGMLATTAAWTWRESERLLGSDAWPTAVARLASASFCGGTVLEEETTGFLEAERFGPVAHLVAALTCRNRHQAADLARRGIDRCTLESFRADVDPLLALSAAIEIDRIVSSVVRGLDEDSLRRLGEVIDGDPELLIPLARALEAAPDARHGGLQGSLDALWQSSLGDLTARALRRIAATAPPTSPPLADALAPFAQPTQNDVPTFDAH